MAVTHGFISSCRFIDLILLLFVFLLIFLTHFFDFYLHFFSPCGQDAAAVVHSDLAKKFIRAQIVHWGDLPSLEGFDSVAKIEGRDYQVQDGDILYFRVMK